MTRHKTKGKLSARAIHEFRGQLLGWYDKHRRILPWRAPEGKKPEPYHVWLSEIMLQQTTVTAVKPYFEKFLAKWPSVSDLAAAPSEDVMHEWAGLGYYARARNLHACAQIVANDLGGIFPDTQDDLKKLPGIGDYTSAAIMAIAFNQPATVVDGNIERVMARYFAVSDPLPASKKKLKEQAHFFFEGYEERPGDFAQALMDLVAAICIPKAPRCGLCPVAAGCEGRKQGVAAELPAKLRGKARPKRTGHVYWIENDKNQVLLHRRPKKGLLGGMLGLPTSEWIQGEVITPPDFIFEERSVSRPSKRIRHVFTHFELELDLKYARCDEAHMSSEYFWSDIPSAQDSGLPSLFEKALAVYSKGGS